MKISKLALLTVLVLALQGCAGAPTMSDFGTAVTEAGSKAFCGRSSLYCELLSESTSENIATGTAYVSPYSIQKTATGKYVLRSGSLKEPIILARPLSLQKLNTYRTQKATFDIYAAPSEDCAQRYMAVVGTERRISVHPFGCETPLSFTSVALRDSVFATETPAADGATPWTYRLTSSGIRGPAAITAFHDHPEYPAYREQERVALNAQRASQRAARRPASRPGPVESAAAQRSARRSASPQADAPAAEARPVGQPRRLPPPEKVTLPGEVEEKEAVYERPTVDL